MIIMAIPTEQVIHMVTAMTTTVVLTIQLFLNVSLMIPLVATMPMLGLKHPVSSKIDNMCNSYYLQIRVSDWSI